MNKYIAIGYPDEENVYHNYHTCREEWHFEDENEADADRRAMEHFYYFHEYLVMEDEDIKE